VNPTARPVIGRVGERVRQMFEMGRDEVARDLGMPNLNEVATMDLALTDATGSGADLVRVKLTRV